MANEAPVGRILDDEKEERSLGVPIMFNDPEKQEFYNKHFYLKTRALGKAVPAEIQKSVKVIKEVFSKQQWLEFLKIEDVVYPSVMNAFYSQLEGEPNTEARSMVRVTKIVIKEITITKALRVPQNGATITTNPNWYDEIGVSEQEVVETLTGMRFLRLKEVRTSSLKPQVRAIYSIVQFTILPRKGNTDVLAGMDAMLLYYLVTFRRVALPKLIISYMLAAVAKGKKRHGALPYGMVLTRILKYLKFPFENESYFFPPGCVFTLMSFRQITQGKKEASEPKEKAYASKASKKRKATTADVSEAESETKKKPKHSQGRSEKKQLEKSSSKSSEPENTDQFLEDTDSEKTVSSESSSSSQSDNDPPPPSRPEKLPFKKKQQPSQASKGIHIREPTQLETGEKESEDDVLFMTILRSKAEAAAKKLAAQKRAQGATSSIGKEAEVSEAYVVIEDASETRAPPTQQFGYTQAPAPSPNDNLAIVPYVEKPQNLSRVSEEVSHSESSLSESGSEKDSEELSAAAVSQGTQGLISEATSGNMPLSFSETYSSNTLGINLDKIIEDILRPSPGSFINTLIPPLPSHPTLIISPPPHIKQAFSDNLLLHIISESPSEPTINISSPPETPLITLTHVISTLTTHSSSQTIIPLPETTTVSEPSVSIPHISATTISPPHTIPFTTLSSPTTETHPQTRPPPLMISEAPATTSSTDSLRIDLLLRNQRDMAARQDRLEAGMLEIRSQLREHEALLLRILDILEKRQG